MDIEYFREYCLSKKAVTESFPFDESTLVFKVAGKMFALVALERNPIFVNLKCIPEYAAELRENFPDFVFEAYHMNKLYWNSVVIDCGIPESMIIELTDLSYSLVVAKLPLRVKREFNL